jgi:hypothetical protein
VLDCARCHRPVLHSDKAILSSTTLQMFLYYNFFYSLAFGWFFILAFRWKVRPDTTAAAPISLSACSLAHSHICFNLRTLLILHASTTVSDRMKMIAMPLRTAEIPSSTATRFILLPPACTTAMAARTRPSRLMIVPTDSHHHVRAILLSAVSESQRSSCELFHSHFLFDLGPQRNYSNLRRVSRQSQRGC